MQKIRRRERAVDLDRTIELVEHNHILRLGLFDDVYPYVVPVNYGYEWHDDQLTLYIHGARQGKKMTCIKNNPHVCVEMDRDSHTMKAGDEAPDYSTAYASVIGFGVATIVTDLTEKRHALSKLMEHETGRKLESFHHLPDEKVNGVGIIQVQITEITGKEHVDPGEHR